MNHEVVMFIEHRQKEWTDLENKALWLLERPAMIRPREPLRQLHPVLRIWHYPSRKIYNAWAIFKSRPNADEEILLVRHVLWDRPHDSARLRAFIETHNHTFNTDPCIHTKDCPMSPSAFDRLVLSHKMPVMIAPAKDSIGLDGANSGLETYEFLGQIRLSWWTGGPPEWSEVINWAAEIRAFLSDLTGNGTG